ncbi:MAG: 6-bladed beta-propeller [Bacteroidales bacterium]|nr:6-bladed beta-propeller [Bacteroidales bacterium]
MKTKFVLLAFSLFVIGCISTEKKEVLYDDGAIVIDINSALKSDGLYYFEDMIESVELIPLETTEASIVGPVSECVVTDNYIFVNDIYDNKGGLAMFDKSGKFIKRFSRGNGPEELPYVSGMFYSDDNLYVDAYEKIVKFSGNGEYVDNKKINVNMVEIQKVGDVYLAIQPEYQNLANKFKILKFDSSMVKMSALNLEPIILPFDSKNFSCYDGVNCLICKFADNNIYCYANDTFKVKYRLDYPDFEYHIPYEKYKGIRGDDLSFEQDIDEGKYFFSGSISECEDYLSMWFRTKGIHAKNVFYNKKTGKTSLLKYHDRSEISPLYSTSSDNKVCMSGQKNTFSSVISPAYMEPNCWENNPNNLFSPKDIETLKNVKADDNPIILIYKLKDDL